MEFKCLSLALHIQSLGGYPKYSSYVYNSQNPTKYQIKSNILRTSRSDPSQQQESLRSPLTRVRVPPPFTSLHSITTPSYRYVIPKPTSQTLNSCIYGSPRPLSTTTFTLDTGYSHKQKPNCQSEVEVSTLTPSVLPTP